MNSVATAVVASAFWIFLAVVSVAAIFADYRKRQLALEPLRLAIEHGQQLAPEIVEKLLAHQEHSAPIDPRDLQVAGIITIASGIGVSVLGIFLNQLLPQYVVLVIGVGAVAICVGIGLLLAAKAVRRHPAARPAADSEA